ncbi:MAG: fumarylacetoacetate hydrolase, partial [Betaproteobacteria bacterium]
MQLTKRNTLPKDWRRAYLVGRVWAPGKLGGPSPVALVSGELYDLSAFFPTTSELLNTNNPKKSIERAISSGAPKVRDL